MDSPRRLDSPRRPSQLESSPRRPSLPPIVPSSSRVHRQRSLPQSPIESQASVPGFLITNSVEGNPAFSQQQASPTSAQVPLGP